MKALWQMGDLSQVYPVSCPMRAVIASCPPQDSEYFQKQPTKANISISQDNPVLYPTNINVLYHSVPSLYTINHITHYVVDNSNIK